MQPDQQWVRFRKTGRAAESTTVFMHFDGKPAKFTERISSLR